LGGLRGKKMRKDLHRILLELKWLRERSPTNWEDQGFGGVSRKVRTDADNVKRVSKTQKEGIGCGHCVKWTKEKVGGVRYALKREKKRRRRKPDFRFAQRAKEEVGNFGLYYREGNTEGATLILYDGS